MQACSYCAPCRETEEVKKQIEALGAECFVSSCDVTDPQSVKEAVATIKKHYGRIDILVNTAGIACSYPMEEFAYE